MLAPQGGPHRVLTERLRSGDFYAAPFIGSGGAKGKCEAGIARTLGPLGFPCAGFPSRAKLLDPILPEKGLAMLYAPRGIGKSWLGLSIGLAVAGGSSLLRWKAPEPRRVLLVDGEMPLTDLQSRLAFISIGLGADIPSGGFRALAADQTESGINPPAAKASLRLSANRFGHPRQSLDTRRHGQ